MAKNAEHRQDTVNMGSERLEKTLVTISDNENGAMVMKTWDGGVSGM